LIGLKGQDIDQVDEPRFMEAVNIESVQYQATFIRELLAETRLPAKAVRPDRDKVIRARALAARYEAGKVFHLKGGPGIDALEREMLTFPNSTHDDMVDALGYAADLTGSTFYFTSGSRGLSL
jgi:predicted phage terminase large subunit-like protein